MKEISDTKVYAACRQIAQKIKERTPQDFTLVAVVRGGLVPTTIIAHWLGIKEIKFIRLSSYNNKQEQSEIVDTTTDIIPDETNTYIIDDICDSGETVKSTHWSIKISKFSRISRPSRNRAIYGLIFHGKLKIETLFNTATPLIIV